MSSKLSLLKPLAAAAMLVAAGASHATFTVYTSLAAFTAATTAQGTDTFAGLSIIAPTTSPITRTTTTGTSYTYTAAAPGDFFGAGTTSDPWLSTNTATDSITINGLAANVRGIGGNFFGSDINGAFSAGNIVLAATDASGTVTQTIVSATTTSFLGFVSTGAITSLVITSTQPSAGFLWPTIDNLVLAQAGVVPEPGTYALMFAGLAAVSLVARRRRA